MILIRTSKRILLPRLSRHLRTTRKHLEIFLFQISTSDSSRYRTDHPVLPRRTDSRLCRGAENRTPSSCSQSKRTTGIRHPDTILNSLCKRTVIRRHLACSHSTTSNDLRQILDLRHAIAPPKPHESAVSLPLPFPVRLGNIPLGRSRHPSHLRFVEIHGRVVLIAVAALLRKIAAKHGLHFNSMERPITLRNDVELACFSPYIVPADSEAATFEVFRGRPIADIPFARHHNTARLRARQESNPQPLGPKPSALSIELRARSEDNSTNLFVLLLRTSVRMVIHTGAYSSHSTGRHPKKPASHATIRP